MSLHLHPLLNNPDAVLVYRSAVPETPAWADFWHVAKEALGVMQVSLTGEKVTIKPNVTSGEHFANPDIGTGTHPAFIGGMVEYLRKHGARRGGIYVVEDPRDSDDNEPRHWKGTGYLEMAAQTGAKLRCPTDYTCVKRPVPRPLVHAVRNVSRLAVAPDTVLINVPKMKTHTWTVTTLSIKNLMGLDRVFDRHYCGQAFQELIAEGRGSDRPPEEWMDGALHEVLQEKIARRLVDLAQVIKPHLNVVEGVVGREGTGFHRGKNYALGQVIAGINMVAVDTVTSYLMGFNPQRIAYLRLAAEMGLGKSDLTQLRVYVVEDGAIVPCRDLEALRAKNPRFALIRNILGGDQEVGYGWA